MVFLFGIKDFNHQSSTVQDYPPTTMYDKKLFEVIHQEFNFQYIQISLPWSVVKTSVPWSRHIYPGQDIYSLPQS